MRRSVVFGCTILSMFVLSCKSSQSQVNIINGIEDVDNIYPAVLQIEVYGYEDQDIGSCTSSVISHNTLITAAHCLEDENTKAKAIKAKLPSKKVVEAKASYTNDKYDYNKDDTDDYDIGIVVFEDHTFDEIMPLKISNHDINKGTAVIIAGYACQTDVEVGEFDWEKEVFPKKVVSKCDGNDTDIRRYGLNVVQSDEDHKDCGGVHRLNL